METKLAIRIKNKAQYNAVIEHMYAKGWRWGARAKSYMPNDFWEDRNNTLCYEEIIMYNANLDYTILSFARFSELTGVVANEEVIDLGETIQVTFSGDHVKLFAGELWGNVGFCLTHDQLNNLIKAWNNQ